MKKSKTVLLATSLFAAAVNINGCGVYGPPEYFEPSWNIAQPEYGAPYYVEPTVTVAPTEADWYMLTKRRYAVLRVLSVPDKKEMSDGQTGDMICGIEVLSAYNVEESLDTISELLIPAKDSALFSEGDVLFVELGRMEHRNGENTYRIAEGDNGVIFTPYKENQLILTDEFRKSSLFDVLWMYNSQIEQHAAAMESGEEFYMEFKPPYFEEGLSTEETELFFENLKDAKENYDVVLEELRNEMVKGTEAE